MRDNRPRRERHAKIDRRENYDLENSRLFAKLKSQTVSRLLA